MTAATSPLTQRIQSMLSKQKQKAAVRRAAEPPIDEKADAIVTPTGYDLSMLRFSAWLPVIAKHFGYSDDEIRMARTEWVKQDQIDHVLASMQYDAECFGLTLPEPVIPSVDEKNGSSMLDGVAHDHTDAAWLRKTIQAFPYQRRRALLIEYGCRFESGQSATEPGVFVHGDACRREANLWLLSLHEHRLEQAHAEESKPDDAAREAPRRRARPI